MKLFGKFQIKTKNVITGVKTDTGWCDNLVLNYAFNEVQSPSDNIFIHLGAGSTPPTVSDVALETFIISKGAGGAQSDKAGASTTFSSPVYSTSAGWELEYAVGEVIGNISEIGVGTSPTTNLTTRALITDALGDPTTITLGVNDILTVNYRVGYELDTSHPPGVSTVDFDGTIVDLTAKWVDLGNGDTNSNFMNGHILPYLFSNTGQTSIWVLDGLPVSPLTSMADASYLLNARTALDNWQVGLVATGSSWTKEYTFTSAVGSETGDWLGVAIGVFSSSPAVLFEFSAPVTKAANKEFTMTVKFEIQRDI